MKEQFINTYKEQIKRDGALELLEWLEKSDFFTAPASTKYHLAYAGGLVEHSFNVYKRLQKLINESEPKLDVLPETVAISSLLHDVCKANLYSVSSRNVKNEQTGQWEKQPFYSYDEKFPFGHGEKSVFLIERFMKLTVEEAISIRFHMGAYEGEKCWNNVSSAFQKYPLAFYLHMADMMSTYLDEKE